MLSKLPSRTTTPKTEQALDSEEPRLFNRNLLLYIITCNYLSKEVFHDSLLGPAVHFLVAGEGSECGDTADCCPRVRAAGGQACCPIIDGN